MNVDILSSLYSDPSLAALVFILLYDLFPSNSRDSKHLSTSQMVLRFALCGHRKAVENFMDI
jgi:hypothetical protein